MMIERILNNSILKILLSISFIFLFVSLIIIEETGPASGFEISIYSSFPFSFWMLFIAAISIGSFVIVACSLYFKDGNLWSFGFIILILGNIIIIGLQVFRGYFLYGTSDPSAHLSIIQYIISFGHISQENYYPILHIYYAILGMVIALPEEVIIKYGQIIMDISFMAYIYILSKEIFPDRGMAILSSACSAPFLFTYYHLTPYPHAFGIFILPLLFYAYFKGLNHPSSSATVIVVLLLVLFPFVHPIAEIVMLASLSLGEATAVILKGNLTLDSFLRNFRFKLAAISLFAFFQWISYFQILGIAQMRLLKSFTTESKEVARSFELVSVVSLNSFDLIDLSLKMYGHIIIFIILSLISSIMVFYGFYTKKAFNRNVLILCTMFWASIFCFYISAYNIGLTTWGRMLGANIGLWSSPVLASFALCKLSEIRIPKKISVLLIISVLIISSLIGIFGIYRSPYIFQPNWQITKMDIAGNDWLRSRMPEKFDFAPMGYIYRPSHYFKMPEHFGYNNITYIGEKINSTLYIALTKRFVLCALDPALKTFINSPDNLAKPGFNELDFIKFQDDRSLNRLYSNGEFDILIANQYRGSQ